MNDTDESLDAIRADFRARKAAMRRTNSEKIQEVGVLLLIVGILAGLFALILRLA